MDSPAFEPYVAAGERKGTKHSKTYDETKEGTFVAPIRIGSRSFVLKHETDAIIRARAAGASDEQMRDLVAKLHAARKVAA